MKSIERWRQGEVDSHVKKFCHRVISKITGLGVPEQDCVTLYLLARDGSGRGCVVEIGGGYGRSTCALARGSEEAGRQTLWSVDPHTGGYLHLKRLGVGQIDSHPIWKENVRALGCETYVCEIRMTSEVAAKDWEKPIRLLFIDGWHPDCAKDIELWYQFVSEDGLIVLDDYFHKELPWVREAVDEMLETRKVSELNRLGRLVWVQKHEPSG